MNKQTLTKSIISLFFILIWPNLGICQEVEPASASQLALEPLQFSPLSTMGALGKLLGAIFVVAGLMALLFKGFKYFGLGQGTASQGGMITVLDSKLIAPKKYISIVQVGRQKLVLAITENNVSFLSHLNEQANNIPPAPPSDFPEILTKASGGDNDQQQNQ